jgi:hypothetical protein
MIHHLDPARIVRAIDLIATGGITRASMQAEAAIGGIAYLNKAAIYALLFEASAETMLAIAADPKHLGARIAITSVLHTWGSAMTHHPHVRMIVPGGGLSPDGKRWVAAKPNFFLPVLVLSRLFRLHAGRSGTADRLSGTAPGTATTCR